MSRETTAIPLFYRIFFTWIDPLNAIWAAYGHFFQPDMVLNAYIPDSARNPPHDMLFQHLGGALLNIAFVDAVLLRYTDDVRVWKIVQAGVLILDWVMIYSLWDALARQGRLQPAVWRLEDWGCVVMNGFITAVRSLFIAEVAFRRNAGAGVKRRS
ncbi:MAG: hypothetical protein M1816_002086 [Peltula sp. TS41687]|nr:MAG: hypothetical protein M1816_002086 [Peltula sp. TS41687]